MTRTALVVSHAHPDFSKGGAEVAAHGLYRGLAAQPGWDAYFLARHGVPGLQRGDKPFMSHADGHELLFASDVDPFNFSTRGGEEGLGHFRDLLEHLRPSVVHFHHYWHVGLEAIRVVKRHDPRVPVVLTLHEYLAICRQNGQMIKSSGQLCTKGSPSLCHACLPDATAEDYFLRKHFIQSFFSQVDLFVAPSHFLKARYVAWGLDPSRIVVLENGQTIRGESRPSWSPAAPDGEAPRNRFAFFGQLNPFKGIELLLDAFSQLPAKVRKQVHLEVHGGANEHIPADFRARIDRLAAESHRNVRLFGPYAPEDQQRLIQGVDWVVVPSTWWENSPMVIQEAFLHGRPVICADIGGMAEKVQDGVTGLHFRARNALSLAQVMERAATTPGLWESLHRNVLRPPSVEESARDHVGYYESLIAASASPLAA